MQFDELTFVCQQAAVDLVAQHRPIAPTVVLPSQPTTRIVTLPEFPEQDQARHDHLAEFARVEITAARIPAWGFLAEAEMGGADVIVLVCGARRNPPQVSAARFLPDGSLDAFLPAEELDPTAMPFLHPLQHAVDALPALEANPAESPLDGGLLGPGTGSGRLPIIEG